jgi:transcription termination/antitermination protein NusG
MNLTSLNPLPADARPKWRAIWTRSHCESLTAEQLTAKGFHPFVPMISEWSVRAGRPHRIRVPMFPGYLFLHDTLDKQGYVEVVKTRGVVALLGASWDRLAEIRESEMAAVQQLGRVDVPVHPHPFLREGERVSINHGPLAGVDGILVRANPHKYLLVVSVELLGRSVAVEIDCAFVRAA